MAQVVVEMTSKEQALFRGMQKLIAQQDTFENSLAKTARGGKKAGDTLAESFGGRALSAVTSYAAGFASVTAALGVANKAFEVWLRNTREMSAESRKAANELIALAAIQEGGQKASAVGAAARLGASFGITDRGMAFDVVQTMQSAYGGDLQRGLSAAREIFAAAQLGVQLESAKEAEVFGFTFGFQPGELLRRLYRAGEISPRDPETLIKAAPGLSFFDDKDFGIAAATTLSGAVPKEELETYVKAAGIALSTQATQEFQKSTAAVVAAMKLAGVPGVDLSQMGKLRALHAAGIDTAAELGGMGLQEIRQTTSLVNLLNTGNLQRTLQFMREIPATSGAGLMEGVRAGIERELPMTARDRELRMLESMYKDTLAFGGEAPGAMTAEMRERIQGLAMLRLGFQQRGPFDLIDEQGRSSPMDRVKLALTQGPAEWLGTIRGELEGVFGSTDRVGQAASPMFQLREEEQRIERELKGMFEAGTLLQKAARSLESAAAKWNGGSAGVPAGVDR